MPRWMPVSEHEAKAYPLYGIGGWLSFYLAGLAFAIVFYLMIFANTTGLWGYPPHKFFLPIVAVEAALVATLLIQGSRRVASYRCLALVLIPIIGVLGIINGPYMTYVLTGEDSMRTGPFLATWSLVWFVYFIFSRRVNVTYSHRVLSEEAGVATSTNHSGRDVKKYITLRNVGSSTDRALWGLVIGAIILVLIDYFFM